MILLWPPLAGNDVEGWVDAVKLGRAHLNILTPANKKGQWECVSTCVYMCKREKFQMSVCMLTNTTSAGIISLTDGKL